MPEKINIKILIARISGGEIILALNSVTCTFLLWNAMYLQLEKKLTHTHKNQALQKYTVDLMWG